MSTLSPEHYIEVNYMLSVGNKPESIHKIVMKNGRLLAVYAKSNINTDTYIWLNLKELPEGVRHALEVFPEAENANHHYSMDISGSDGNRFSTEGDDEYFVREALSRSGISLEYEQGKQALLYLNPVVCGHGMETSGTEIHTSKAINDVVVVGDYVTHFPILPGEIIPPERLCQYLAGLHTTVYYKWLECRRNSRSYVDIPFSSNRFLRAVIYGEEIVAAIVYDADNIAVWLNYAKLPCVDKLVLETHVADRGYVMAKMGYVDGRVKLNSRELLTEYTDGDSVLQRVLNQLGCIEFVGKLGDEGVLVIFNDVMGDPYEPHTEPQSIANIHLLANIEGASVTPVSEAESSGFLNQLVGYINADFIGGARVSDLSYQFNALNILALIQSGWNKDIKALPYRELRITCQHQRTISFWTKDDVIVCARVQGDNQRMLWVNGKMLKGIKYPSSFPDSVYQDKPYFASKHPDCLDTGTIEADHGPWQDTSKRCHSLQGVLDFAGIKLMKEGEDIVGIKSEDIIFIGKSGIWTLPLDAHAPIEDVTTVTSLLKLLPSILLFPAHERDMMAIANGFVDEMDEFVTKVVETDTV